MTLATLHSTPIASKRPPSAISSQFGSSSREYRFNEKLVFSSVLLVLACFTTALLIDLYVYKHGYSWPPIRSDGFGYYLYLPAIFIHGDIVFKFFNDPTFAAAIHADYPFSDWSWAGLTAQADGFVNKHPVGTAIMQMPFFLGAWTIAKINTAAITGFELPFQVACCISGAFYFAASIYLLFRILYQRMTVLAAYFCLLFALTTTNVLLYASYDASFSHIYSFFLVSALCALVVASDWRVGRSFAFGMLLGLAVIVRPTNMVAILLFGELTKNLDHKQIIKMTALVLCGFALTALPQALISLETSGYLIHYSYGEEGFHFLRPQVLNYLFSLNKGVFFWQPAYLLMIVLLVVHYQRFRREALIYLAIIMINLYAGAAWSQWWFGGSFGSRQTIDVLPLMVITTGSVFSYLVTVRRPSLLCLCAVLTIGLATVNLVQMHGYIVGTIPFEGTTWKIYKGFWMSTLDLVQ
jgi:hypothetical protein